MASSEGLEQRYEAVRQRVADAARRSGRAPEDVILIAVTKHAEPDDIRRLMELGHADYGENRVQQLIQRAGMAKEWLDRVGILKKTAGDTPEDALDLDPAQAIRWHLIGPLQRNKAKKLVEVVRLVHTVDSLRVAEELQTAMIKLDRRLDVIIQIDVAGEDAKHGCAVPAAMPLAEQIDSMYHLNLRGVMTMAPYSDNPEDARPHFARCRELFDDIDKLGVGEGRFNLLSMGMSGDFEVAIEEGANLVRVGSAIFGERAAAPTADEAEPEEDEDEA
ncbi:MAG: YggS family pyridoxal phosphate-dependent enzyme, partial [Planctomycetota bacterium]